MAKSTLLLRIEEEKNINYVNYIRYYINDIRYLPYFIVIVSEKLDEHSWILGRRGLHKRNNFGLALSFADLISFCCKTHLLITAFD